MKSENIQISSLASLLLTVKALKRHDATPILSPAEKAERVSSVIARLAAYQNVAVVATSLQTGRSAEER
jgi:hypothetical protein